MRNDFLHVFHPECAIQFQWVTAFCSFLCCLVQFLEVGRHHLVLLFFFTSGGKHACFLLVVDGQGSSVTWIEKQSTTSSYW